MEQSICFYSKLSGNGPFPLNLSLNTEQSMYADLLFAQGERAKGHLGRNGDAVLADMDRILEHTEKGQEP